MYYGLYVFLKVEFLFPSKKEELIPLPLNPQQLTTLTISSL